MPKDLPDCKDKYGYGGWINLEHHKTGCARMMRDGEFFREVEANVWDPHTRMGECKNHDVDIQILSTVPAMFSYWAKAADALEVSVLLNDHIAGVVAEFPQRFIGLGTIPLQNVDLAISEMERCMSDLGLAGVEIGTNVNQMNLDDELLFSVFEAAQDLNAAIFVHPWDMMGQDNLKKYWLSWLVGMPAETSRAICSMIFGGVFERLPNLRVAFAHGGGAFPAILGRVQHGFNVRPDLCAVDNKIDPVKYLGKFWVDSLVHDNDALDYLINKVGIDKIALGTDYPFPLGELEPGGLITNSSLSIDDKQKLLSQNALDWLGLESF